MSNSIPPNQKGTSAAGQNPRSGSGYSCPSTRSSTAGRTTVQRNRERFEPQGHTPAREASPNRTGGSSYSRPSHSSSTTSTASYRPTASPSVAKQSAGKADSHTTAEVLQLRSDKKELEQRVKEQRNLIESQLKREHDDKERLAEAKRDAERIKAEATNQLRSQMERHQADIKRQRDEYEGKLHAVQDELNQEKERRKQTNHLLENQKVRSKNIVVRCLALLRSSRDGHGIFHGHLGISFESPQQERKYQAMAHTIMEKLQPNASVTVGAQPDGQYDVVFHLARTEGGRTVNLKPSIRQEFKCDNVILVLLRSGKNPDVYSTFVPYDSNEYSGILFGQRGERRVIVQLLHWENEWVDCKLNDENVKLLKELVSQACPRMLEELQEDQLLKALGLQEGQY